MRQPTRFIAVLVLALSVLGAGQALAAGVWYNYNLTVPKFGGEAYTNNERKQYAGHASISSTSVGGDYTLKVWLERYNGDDVSCTSCYRIGDNTLVRISNSSYAGDLVHMTLKTDFTTPVDVLSYGKWSPDNP